MKIHQALHGYREGHRLLAASVSLNPAEERRLDAMSDLSGYLDRAASFPHYHTGYPCGETWVYARTWLDLEAERRGTVLTHSLLIPRAELTAVDDLARLDPLFVRPTRPFNLARWREVATLPTAPPKPAPILSPTTLQALAWSFFAQDRRPILWDDPETAEPAARRLWTWLPPWIRGSWSFCTVALQPRYLDDRPLDWLGVAVPGSTVFYPLRDAAVTISGRSRDLPEITWRTLFEHPASEVQQMWAALRDAGFGEISTPQLRLALSFRALEQRNDFAARLSQLDILERLSADGKPVAEQTVRRSLASLRQETSGLITAHDLVVRAPHRRAPALEDQVFQALYEAIRGSELMEPEVARLPGLLASADACGLASPVERGLVDGVNDAADPVARLAALNTASPELAWRALMGLSPVRQSTILARLFGRPETAALAARLAPSRPTLAAEALRAFPEHAPTLLGRWLDDPPTWSRQDWVEVLEGAGHGAVLGSVVNRGSPGEAATRALAAVLAPQVDLVEVGERLPVWLRAPVLARQFEEFPERLDAQPIALLRWLLSSRTEVERGALLRLVDRSEPEALFHASPVDQLPEGRVGARWAARVAPVAAVAALRGDEPLAAALSWIARADDELDTRALRGLLAHPPSGGLSAAIRLLAAPQAREARDRGTLESCFEAWPKLSAQDRWAARDAWLELLKTLKLENREAHRLLCVLLLAMSVNEPRPEGAGLAEASFETVHTALCDDDRFSWLNPWKWIERLWGMDWDRAKHVRKAVARAWVRAPWPPKTVLTLADRDLKVLEKMLEAARDEPGGKEAIAGLLRQNLPDWARRAWMLKRA